MKVLEEHFQRVNAFRTCVVQLIEIRTIRLNTYKYVVTIGDLKHRERVFSDAAYSIAKERFLQECENVKQNAK